MEPRYEVFDERLETAVARDSVWGGSGYLAGQTPGLLTINGRPAQRRIIVFERASLSVVGVCRSKSDGTWETPNLNPQRKYLLIAVDDNQEYEPVAWDWLTPATETDPPDTDAT